MTFQKGTIANKGGRPKGARNKLTVVKDHLVAILSKRLSDKNELKNISTETLVRFVGQIVPKDLSLKVAPDIQYITNTPRPDLTLRQINQENNPQQLKVVEYKSRLDNNTIKVSLKDNERADDERVDDKRTSNERVGNERPSNERDNEQAIANLSKAFVSIDDKDSDDKGDNTSNSGLVPTDNGGK